MREIINPRWGNNEKTHIIAKFRYDDGREVTASITNEGGNNPDWAEIMEKHGVGEVDKISHEHWRKHVDAKARQAEDRKINVERARNEMIFNVKAEAFDNEIIRNSKNRKLKNMIRRATTINEVQIFSAALVILEHPDLRQLFKQMILESETTDEGKAE